VRHVPEGHALEFATGGLHGRSMGMWYRSVVRPLLFRLDPEVAHERSITALRVASALAPVCAVMRWRARAGVRSSPVEAFGLRFPNRVGLAAGFDKNGVCWPALGALGFGHVEVGTVTLHGQPGNDRPRLFRYPPEEAVINRMGFNNDGAAAMARRLARGRGPGRRSVPVGVNIGKSRAASLDEAVEDYLGSFRLLAGHADYVAVNISSPNTPDLRKLQDGERVRALLGALQRENAGLGAGARPLLVKIAPDLSCRQIDDVLQAATDFGLAGIIATNTTLARPGAFAAVKEQGGLSGRPIRRRSTEVVDYIVRRTGGRLPVIGVGGIDDAVSAAEKIDAGAVLVQLYTGMIFHGPWLAREIARALAPNDRAWGMRVG
jgi:dihydroorotate dehydrogenase